MAAPLIIAAAAGTALQVYGTWKASRDQAALLRRRAELDHLKALEVLERNKINTDLLFKEGQKLHGEQAAQFAASGRAASASTFSMMAETANDIADQAIRNQRAAQWEATMINKGADSDLIAASQIKRAGDIAAIGQGILGAARIADRSPGFSPSRSTTPSTGSGGGSQISGAGRGPASTLSGGF